MAARVLAQLVVMGGGILFRAASKAYQQAIVNGKRAGVDAETATKAATGAGKITVEEARKILGIDANTTREATIQRFQRMYEQNEKHGSFYILSKVYRSMEVIDPEIAQKVDEARAQANQEAHEASKKSEGHIETGEQSKEEQKEKS